jgi:hypothetical protein
MLRMRRPPGSALESAQSAGGLAGKMVGDGLDEFDVHHSLLPLGAAAAPAARLTLRPSVLRVHTRFGMAGTTGLAKFIPGL